MPPDTPGFRMPRNAFHGPLLVHAVRLSSPFSRTLVIRKYEDRKISAPNQDSEILVHHFHAPLLNELSREISNLQEKLAFLEEMSGPLQRGCLQSLCKLRPGQTVFPTQANFTTSMELGIVWPPTWLELARVGSSWLEFDQAQIFAQLEPVFPTFGQLKPTLAKLFCYCYLTTRSYSAQLNGFL